MVDTRQTLGGVSCKLVKSSANAFHAELSEFDEIVESALQQVDELYSQLAAQATSLDERAAGLDRWEQELAARQQQSELVGNAMESQEARLTEVLEEVRGVRSDAADRSADTQLADRMSELHDQLQGMREDAAARSADTQLADRMSELHDQLQGMREDAADRSADTQLADRMSELHDQLQGMREDAADRSADTQLADRMSELHDQLQGMREDAADRSADTQLADRMSELHDQLQTQTADQQVLALVTEVHAGVESLRDGGTADIDGRALLETIEQLQEQMLAQRDEITTHSGEVELAELVSQLHGELREGQVSTSGQLSEQLVGLVETLQGDVRQVRDEVAQQVDEKQAEALREIQTLRDALQEQQDLRQDWQVQAMELLQQLEKAEVERQAYQQRITESLADVSHIERVAVDLANTRNEIAKLEELLQNPGRDVEQDAAEEQALASQIDSLEQERIALELELELVRSRAAELYETVEQQQQTFADQHQEVVRELVQLKGAVERQGEMLEIGSPASGSVPVMQTPQARDAEGTKPAGDKKADPVVNSVASQFAKLQQDASRRRKRTN